MDGSRINERRAGTEKESSASSVGLVIEGEIISPLNFVETLDQFEGKRVRWTLELVD